jgi:hypothetical protein
VQFLGTFDEPEPISELAVQGLRVISHSVETAALRGALGTESAYDDMAAGLHGPRSEPDVGVSLLLPGEKVKNGAIMPHVEGMGGEIRTSNVGANPLDRLSSFPKPFFGYIQGGL